MNTPASEHRAANAYRHSVQVVPGLTLAVVVAAVAYGVSVVTPGPVGAVPVAVVLGLAVGQVVPRAPVEKGIGVATKRILRLGIILLGARLSLAEVAQLGLGSVGLVVATLVVGFATAWFVGRAVGVSAELSALLGIGSAVCGNTAIMASAPIIKAPSRDVSLAVATITLCGTVALLVYPWIGRALGMSDVGFGIWAGLAVQDTSQVVATGAAFSDEARDVATVVKLVRNTSLAAILPLLAWWWQRSGRSAEASGGWRKAFPLFVLGFLALAGLRSVGVIDEQLGNILAEAANIAILIAVAGLGLSVTRDDIKQASGRSVAVGALAAAVLGLVALGAALTVGPLIGP